MANAQRAEEEFTKTREIVRAANRTAPAERPQSLTQLTDRQGVVRQRILALANGEGRPREDIVKLTAEAASLKRRIEAACVAATQANEKQAQEEAAARRTKFEVALVEAAEQKALFAAHYRSACLALGGYCAAMSAAATLSRSLNTALGLAPLDANRIKALSENLDPLPSVANVKPETDLGWRLSFPVVPLHEIGKEKL